MTVNKKEADVKEEETSEARQEKVSTVNNLALLTSFTVFYFYFSLYDYGLARRWKQTTSIKSFFIFQFLNMSFEYFE